MRRRVKFINSFSFEGGFGFGWVNILHDEEDNILVYSGGENLDNTLEGRGINRSSFEIELKVKDFSIYRGMKQTRIKVKSILN